MQITFDLKYLIFYNLILIIMLGLVIGIEINTIYFVFYLLFLAYFVFNSIKLKHLLMSQNIIEYDLKSKILIILQRDLFLAYAVFFSLSGSSLGFDFLTILKVVVLTYLMVQIFKNIYRLRTSNYSFFKDHYPRGNFNFLYTTGRFQIDYMDLNINNKKYFKVLIFDDYSYQLLDTNYKQVVSFDEYKEETEIVNNRIDFLQAKNNK